ncbi:MAG: HAMP domain-containing protein [Pyrinomonadaceae bacterium]|nr:HAMP domain-containing protein [Pyrinomonadaceae bacterium]
MKILNSAKFRLTLWYVGVLSCILIIFAGATYLMFTSFVYAQVDSTLVEIANSFENTFRSEVVDEDSKSDKKFVEAVNEATLEVRFKNYRLFVFSERNKLLSQTDSTNADIALSGEKLMEVLANYKNLSAAQTTDLQIGDNSFRLLFQPMRVNDRELFLIIATPLDDVQELLQNVRISFLLGVPVALAFASVGGFLLARKSFSPIVEMSDRVSRITARNLYERLPVGNSDEELKNLAQSFNHLLERLKLSFEQQQRFMADASHELRTPVSIIRGEAEVSLTKEKRSTKEYKETLLIIQSESERMSKIIEELFMLSRADSGEKMLTRSSIYIDDVLGETIRSFRTIAQKMSVKIENEVDIEMPAQADPALLRRLFVNLTDNAIKHARSLVKVEAARETNRYVITFSNDGDPVPAISASDIFDRFYRVDKARSRDNGALPGGGAGLGLPIARWIAEMHAGTLQLTRSDQHVTTFTFSMPI